MNEHSFDVARVVRPNDPAGNLYCVDVEDGASSGWSPIAVPVDVNEHGEPPDSATPGFAIVEADNDMCPGTGPDNRRRDADR